VALARNLPRALLDALVFSPPCSEFAERSSCGTAQSCDTLAEAGAFILAMPEGFKERISWQRATERLMEAALHEGDIRAATEAIERAGFVQFLWMPRTR
jgi:hypothetical protein